MATHRPQDPASAALAARHQPVTPDTLARRLRARPPAVRPTVIPIQDALAQVQHWREQLITRDLLQHRRQLIVLRFELEVQWRRLGENWAYLTMLLLRETDALLQNSMTALCGGGTDVDAQ